MKLYKVERVERIEASEEFQAAMRKTAAKKAAAKRALETKGAAMQSYLSDLSIEVAVMGREELIQTARESFRSLGYPEAYPTDERLCVNYLRHCGSKYEKELENIAGKVGCRDAYFEIKQMVLDEIELTYDWLAEECRRQSARLEKQRDDESWPI